jgi:superfamily II DNA or RNA helicase
MTLLPAAHAYGDDSVVMDRSKAQVLRQVLTGGTAARARWTWTSTAQSAEINSIATANALARVTATTIEEQTTWPEGLDLAAHGFVRALRPFQRDAVARLLIAGGGANFSVPGSGKTAVTYAVFTALRARGSVHGMLVIAPPAAFEAWVEEGDECFAEGHRPTVRIRPRCIANTDDVVVFNYERLADPSVMASIRSWARNRKVLTVFDEAHRAKAGEASRRGADAAALARECDASMVLTGTPMPNRPDDLAAVFDLVWPGHGQRLVDGDLAHLRSQVFVRVTNDDLRLPPVDLRVETVELDPPHQALYAAMADHIGKWASGPHATAAEAGRALMHLIAAATNPAAVFAPGEPWSLPMDRPDVASLAALIADPTRHIRPAKIVRAVQIVADHRARGRKTLVWSNFVENVGALAEALAPHDPAVVLGATPVEDASAPTDRRRELDRFRNDPDCWVLVATPQTLGEGVSLHRTCIDQVHVDRGYAAGTWLQSFDRTHRLGLSDDADPTCTVIHAAGTIDMRVAEVLNEKVTAMADALGDRALLAVADPTIVPEDPVAALLGDVDALRELFAGSGQR